MKSILLVDDEATICVELQRTIRELGYHVEIAHTVESALGSISKFRFDGIIVEFNLSSENAGLPRFGGGIRLISELRNSGTTIPILMFTVMMGEMYKMASVDAGANEFIPKPITIPRLVSHLRAHILRQD